MSWVSTKKQWSSSRYLLQDIHNFLKDSWLALDRFQSWFLNWQNWKPILKNTSTSYLWNYISRKLNLKVVHLIWALFFKKYNACMIGRRLSSLSRQQSGNISAVKGKLNLSAFSLKELIKKMKFSVKMLTTTFKQKNRNLSKDLNGAISHWLLANRVANQLLLSSIFRKDRSSFTMKIEEWIWILLKKEYQKWIFWNILKKENKK